VGDFLSQVRSNKLFPQKKFRPEMAQKERKRKKGTKKLFLAHRQILVKCPDLILLNELV
jgi:hypothetical protein